MEGLLRRKDVTLKTPSGTLNSELFGRFWKIVGEILFAIDDFGF